MAILAGLPLRWTARTRPARRATGAIGRRTTVALRQDIEIVAFEMSVSSAVRMASVLLTMQVHWVRLRGLILKHHANAVLVAVVMDVP